MTTIATKNQVILDIHSAQRFWKDPKITRKVVSRLAQKGWLKRLMRGKYLRVPLEAGPERQWSEDPYVLGCGLSNPSAVAYWSAMRYWNWTEQLPRIIYIQTTQQKWKKRTHILGTEYAFVQMLPKRFFGIRCAWRGSQSFFVTDKEKTILDSLDRIDLCGGIRQVYEALHAAHAELDWGRLMVYLARLGNGAVAKRLGFMLELFNTDSAKTKKVILQCHKLMTQGISLLYPGAGNQGKINQKWRIRINCAGFSNDISQ